MMTTTKIPNTSILAAHMLLDSAVRYLRYQPSTPAIAEAIAMLERLAR